MPGSRAPTENRGTPMSAQMPELQDLILDGTKVHWHRDRIAAWDRGERISPITIDWSLLPRAKCNYSCAYCYASEAGQFNVGHEIKWPHIERFLRDCAEIGVRGLSLVSDGESSHHPDFVRTIVEGSRLGLDMAVGSNGLILNEPMSREIVPALTYFRFNISAGEPDRYAEIMGVKKSWFYRVCESIRGMVRVKRATGSACTIGMQMVLDPKFADQILPLTKLALALEVDYLIIKHCSDDEFGNIGVDYQGYDPLYPLLREAESLSSVKPRSAVKWSKIGDKGTRNYERCYGPPFIIQLSGTGLVAPCGMLFHERYKEKFHIGNICETGFKEIWQSDRYWEVMRLLSSDKFNAKTMCGTLCLQHRTNDLLNQHKEGKANLLDYPLTPLPPHGSFI